MHAITPRLPLKDRHPLRVVITGSTQGLGKALAAQFVRNGHRVVINARTPRALNELSKELGEDCHVVAADVARYSGSVRVYQAAIRDMGGVDLWINNAGTNAHRRCATVELSAREARAIVETNLLGTVYGSQMAVRAMRENAHGGVIVNMEGSGLNSPSVPGYSVYEATKVAIGHFSGCLRSEVREHDVNVCTLSPGLMGTTMSATDEGARLAARLFGSTPERVATAMYTQLLRYGHAARRVVYLTPCKVVVVVVRNLLREAFRRRSPSPRR